MNLSDMGWSPSYAAAHAALNLEHTAPARVIVETRRQYGLKAESGDYQAEVTGRFAHEVSARADFPVVGDWVAAELLDDGRARIHAVLPRHSRFSRKAAGPVTEEQVLAANVDTVFLVTGLDHDFSLRRIERYLVTAWDSGARPVILLNKADTRDEPERYIDDVGTIAHGVPVHALSALTGDGMEALRVYCTPGATLAVLGSSGVGKSTIINALFGEARQATQAVREDDSRGRHTTTHRELFFLESGAMVIDTPGMREFAPWTDEAGVAEGFADIEALAEACRYRDCTHENEPGCAVRAALASGELDHGRIRGYRNLQREARWLDRKQDEQARRAESRKWKNIAKMGRQRRRFEERNP